jgi:hypothetical protein
MLGLLAYLMGEMIVLSGRAVYCLFVVCLSGGMLVQCPCGKLDFMRVGGDWTLHTPMKPMFTSASPKPQPVAWRALAALRLSCASMGCVAWTAQLTFQELLALIRIPLPNGHAVVAS